KSLNLIQYPNYSSCGLFSIPLLRTSHVVRASSYLSELNSASGVKGSVDSTVTELLERLQYKLAPNVHVPSLRVQRILVSRSGVINARLIRTPFYIETPEWDTTVYDQFFKDKKYVLYFGRFQLHKGFHTLAEALPRFLSCCADAHVALIGRDVETSLASSMAAFARAQCNHSTDRLMIME